MFVIVRKVVILLLPFVTCMIYFYALFVSLWPRNLKNKKNVTVFPACLFDAEQHVISSSELNKTF